MIGANGVLKICESLKVNDSLIELNLSRTKKRKTAMNKKEND